MFLVAPSEETIKQEIALALRGRRPLPRSFLGYSQSALERAAGLTTPVAFDPAESSFVEAAPLPPSIPAASAEEAIVALFGRPSMLVVNGAIVSPESDEWKRRLEIVGPLIAPILGSVGRVNLANHDELDWGGTAWVVAPRFVITNRHVAQLFADGYPNRRGFFTGQPIRASISFASDGVASPNDTAVVTQVRYIAPVGADVPDVAILQVAGPLPRSIELGDDANIGDWIGAIGYPARDSRNGADAQDRIFGRTYGVKRFAPGKVMQGPGEAPFVLAHDASTLGGNSGSVVVDLRSGKAVGLHFAGRYLVSNYAVKASKIKEILQSLGDIPVLEVRDRSTALDESFDEARVADKTHSEGYFDGRTGYDAQFLGDDHVVPWPDMGQWAGQLAPLKRGNEHRLDYTHFSVVMHAARRMPLLTAVNIDGSQSRTIKRSKDTWYFDGRLDRKYQIGNEEGYLHNKLDRGHQVRREDPNWGTEQEAAQANEDTFHYTNSCPQHEKVNQRTWLELENFVLSTARARDAKVTVFTGPVLREDDFPYRDIQIPAEFFKVVAVVDDATGELEVTAYLQSQTDYLGNDLDEAVFDGGSTYQVPVAHIEAITKLDFGTLRDSDPMRNEAPARAQSTFRGRRIRKAADIRHR